MLLLRKSISSTRVKVNTNQYISTKSFTFLAKLLLSLMWALTAAKGTFEPLPGKI